jgi:hypothetical protein
MNVSILKVLRNPIGKKCEYFVFLFGGSGDCTQGFVLVKQVLYQLSHISSPFYSGYFSDGVFQLFAQVGLEL